MDNSDSEREEGMLSHLVVNVLDIRIIRPTNESHSMRRVAKVVVAIAVVVVLAFFFLAPVALWLNLGSPIAGQTMSVPVYRSLGCATVGIGDLYAPTWSGFSFGCKIPVPIPF
jgi:hypothetical protein